MDQSAIYIAISIIALGLVVIFLFFTPRMKNKNRLTVIAYLAFIFIISGILLGENRVLGYTLIGAGVLMAVIDMARNRKLF
jgi:hypothetical protein